MGMRMSGLSLLLIMLITVGQLEAYPGGLYSPEDAVVSLDSQNFLNTVTGRPHGWVVEFYASWCGHCQAFAPHYKKFATAIAAWADVIQVAAVDCAQRENVDLCSWYGVMSYPSVKFFPPWSSQQEVGIFRSSWDKSVPSLKQDTIDYLENVRIPWQYRDSTRWPPLAPVLGYGSETQALEILASRLPQLLVILEDRTSYVGREVILDVFSSLNNTEAVRRIVANERTMASLADYSLRDLPILASIEPGQREVRVILSNGTVKTIVEAIFQQWNGFQYDDADDLINNILVDEDEQENAALEEEQHMAAINATVEDLRRRRYTVHLSDLEKTVVYALTHEVAKHKALDMDQLTALFDFVKVLVDYFPKGSVLMPYLTSLLSARSRITKGDTVGDRLTNHLQPLIDRYEAVKWAGCRGSAPRYGGYPCGQWSLWHTLTVRQRAAQRGRPTQVLTAMVGYIKQFFGCRECADHFVAATRGGADFAAVATSYDAAVLYLWGKHNEVNRRLAAEATNEDPVYPKTDFPSAVFCPGCVSSDGQGWSRDQVLEFLAGLYGSPVGEGAVASAGGRPGRTALPWLCYTAAFTAFILTFVG